MQLFGQEGYDATMSELKENLTDREVVEMIPASSITNNIFNLSLGYLMYLKKKRDGQCKARGIADGRLQREYITRKESDSPTVSTYALFAVLLI